jgi:hypothetical protein
VKHASATTIEGLAPLLRALRTRAGLRERKPGVFYRGSRAYLHFHEDPAGTFADVRLCVDFVRMRATTRAEWRALLEAVDASLDGAPVPPAIRRSER